MVPPVRVIGVAIWVSGWGLYWSTSLTCSTMISLTEGTVGQCSPWCSVD